MDKEIEKTLPKLEQLEGTSINKVWLLEYHCMPFLFRYWYHYRVCVPLGLVIMKSSVGLKMVTCLYRDFFVGFFAQPFLYANCQRESKLTCKPNTLTILKTPLMMVTLWLCDSVSFTISHCTEYVLQKIFSLGIKESYSVIKSYLIIYKKGWSWG